MHRPLLFLSIVVAVFALSSTIVRSAHAAPRTHDGFYLRLTLGFGGLDMERSVSTEVAGQDFSTGDSSISGGVGHFETTLGGSPAPGFVIGGSFLWYSMAGAQIKNDAGDTLDLDSPLRLFVFGPTIDWFPNSHGGFHLGGTLGIAAAYAKLPDNQLFPGIGGAGGALSFAIGYDWWIAREWSLGALVRLTGAGIKGEDTESGVTAKEDSSIGVLTVGFAALFH